MSNEEQHPEGGYPHINLMDRGTGPNSIDYRNNPVKEKLSTCRCNSCMDLYAKIHNKPHPLEYRTPKDQTPVPSSTPTGYNAWVCPSYQARPEPEIEELIRRAPWVRGRMYHSQDGITPDIDEDGAYFLPGSIHHHLKQFTDLSK